MTKPATSENMKKLLSRGLLAAALTALIAVVPAGIAAAGDSKSWSVAVHIEYPDGFVYEHAFATGVPTSEVSSILAACNSAHRWGSAVRYHCFPIPE